MSRDLSEFERAAVESLIDTCSLAAVMEAISGICDAKAEHIRASYEGDNDPTARRWATACGFTGCTAADIGRLGI